MVTNNIALINGRSRTNHTATIDIGVLSPLELYGQIIIDAATLIRLPSQRIGDYEREIILRLHNRIDDYRRGKVSTALRKEGADHDVDCIEKIVNATSNSNYLPADWKKAAEWYDLDTRMLALLQGTNSANGHKGSHGSLNGKSHSPEAKYGQPIPIVL